MAEDRVSVLIIRAWLEPESTKPLRAHIRHTTDVSAGLQEATIVADEDALVEVVRAWLRNALLDGASPADTEAAP